MSQTDSRERAALLKSLTSQREHILQHLAGLSDEELRRPVLPTGWTCLGLVQHLTYDVEQFWFTRVTTGEPVDPARAAPAGDAWQVRPELTGEEVLSAYRREIASADAVIAATALDAEPAAWPDFFPRFLDDFRAIILHAITETACHAGQLDAARELIDGKTWLILT
jgi:uncharacterized damage-inducible protein DinB